MRQALAAYDRAFRAPGQASQQERQALASLGYLSTRVVAGSGPLPDPRARIEAFEALKQGNEAFDARDCALASELYRRALAVDPWLVNGWLDLARCQVELGNLEASLAPFREALERGADPLAAAQEGLEVLRRLDRSTQALEFVDLAIANAPSEPRLRFLHGQVLMSQHRFDDALADAEAALRLAPQSADAVYFRGSVQIGRGEVAAAEADLRRALSLDPTHTPAMSDLAAILAQRHDFEGARALLQQVVTLRPEDKMAAENLRRLEARMNSHPG
jgi:tetratricopeptide (TPR) repeat protein